MKKKNQADYIDVLLTHFLNGMMAVGTFLMSFFILSKRAAAVVYQKVLRTPVLLIKHFFLKLRKRESMLYQKWLKTIYGMRRFGRSMVNVIRAGYRAHPEKPVVYRVGSSVSAFFHAARRQTSCSYENIVRIFRAMYN